MPQVLESAQARGGAEVEAVRALLDRVLSPPRDFAIRLWDDTVFGGEQATRFTLVLNSPGAAQRMFSLPLELALGEAYIFGDFDLEGDFFAAFELKDRAKAAIRTPADVLALLRLRRALPGDPGAREGRRRARLFGRRHSRERDRRAIQYHYDAGNDFYALWLDQRMIYTCAYYPSGTEDLDTAQELKLEHICRKLRLSAGERLLDIGCGWGGFCIFAAQNYGVRALGVTLSAEQHRLASERIAAAGLGGQVEVRLMDYRDVAGAYDKIAAIGVLEHIGSGYTEFFQHVSRLLVPGGLFLNHAIAAPPHAEAWRRHSLPKRLLHRHLLGTGLVRERYVFPDGRLNPLSLANLSAEEAGFEVRDVEDLREHYALTLRHWVARLEARHADAVRIAGESAYRTWRLYMTSSALEFEKGNVSVNQTLFSRPVPGRRSVPLSRADLYSERRARRTADVAPQRGRPELVER